MTADAEVRPAGASATFDWSAADAYLFDIDGTLLNTRDAVHYFAFNHALRNCLGVETSIDGVPVHGNTDMGILRAVLRREGISDQISEARIPAMLAEMIAEVERNHEQMRAEPCPAVADLVGRLAAQGKLLGVASGNLERIGWLKVEKAGLRQFFQFGAFCDGRERRADIFRHGLEEARRRLAPNATVFVVGDTPADIAAAKEVGIPVIAVATGIFTQAQLAAEQPDLCVSCCAELLA